MELRPKPCVTSSAVGHLPPPPIATYVLKNTIATVGLNSKVTGLMFTKLLHNVAESTPCDLLKPLNDRPILFQTPEQRVKAVNFNFCKKLPNLIGYHSNVPWVTAKLMSVL